MGNLNGFLTKKILKIYWKIDKIEEKPTELARQEIKILNRLFSFI